MKHAYGFPHVEPAQGWCEIIDAWLSDLAMRGMSPQTIRTRWYQLNEFSNFVLTPVSQVKSLDAMRWIGVDLAPTTRNGRRAALRSFFQWAVRNRVVDEDPSEDLPKVKTYKVRGRICPEEVVMKIPSIVDFKSRLMCELAAYVGLRRTEIAMVSTYDVTEDSLGHCLLVHGKGGKEALIPLPESVAKEILSCPPGYVFPGARGGHCCSDHVATCIRRELGVNPHSLRHRFGTRVYEESGNNILVAKEMLRHSSVATTQVYVYTAPPQLREAVEKARHARTKLPASHEAPSTSDPVDQK
jgi:integrase